MAWTPRYFCQRDRNDMVLDRLARLDRPSENDMGHAKAILRPLPQETAKHRRLDMDVGEYMNGPTCDPKTHPSPCACCEWRLTVELPAIRAEVVKYQAGSVAGTAEINRLQAESDKILEAARVLGEERDEARADVERLKSIPPLDRKEYISELEAEVKRVTDDADASAALLWTSTREIARLHGRVKELEREIVNAEFFARGGDKDAVLDTLRKALAGETIPKKIRITAEEFCCGDEQDLDDAIMRTEDRNARAKKSCCDGMGCVNCGDAALGDK